MRKRLAVVVFGVVSMTGAVKSADDPNIPVYHEPHHRMVFEAGVTRILDLQIAPDGDTSLFHRHDSAILYVVLNSSPTRTQDFGADWTNPPAARATQPAPTTVRVFATTSYVEKPVTHRLTNVGDQLFRAICVLNSSTGSERLSAEQAGFSATPELANRWFRAYRFKLQPGAVSPRHRHSEPTVLVQTSPGHVVASGRMPWEMNEAGRWAWFDSDDTHEIRNAGEDAVELVEIEVRRP